MSLAVAIQMDPIDTINIDADSTFALALEGQARGHALFHYLPQALTLRDGRLFARGRKLEVFRRHGNHHRFGEFEELDLAGFDVDPDAAGPAVRHGVHYRDAPVGAAAETGPLVVNDPASVRNAPEKLFVLRFKELMPPTLLTLDVREIREFWREHGDIILKPLFGNGGAGVFICGPGDENLNALLEMYSAFHREPVMVQRYVPEVRRGDKRIILVEGEPVGAVNRVPPEGEARANLHVGGRAEMTTLTEREREICSAIGPTLREQGLVFVGIDVIGDYITEINVTSPTGIQEIARLDGVDLAVKIWDAIEARHAARRHRRPS